VKNYLLLAGPTTEPLAFLERLDRHPEISAPPPVSLGEALHGAARRAVQAARADGSERDDVVRIGRLTGAQALESAFARVRAARRSEAVVLHDPNGPRFPLTRAVDVSLLVLVRDAEAAAAALGAIQVERVVQAAREAVQTFRDRVSAFRFPRDRVLTVEEDRLVRHPDSVDREICRMLGVAGTSDAVSAMGGRDLAAVLPFADVGGSN